MWFGVPWFYGLFFANRIECTTCFREVFLYCLSFFGYVVLGGFIYSFSKPREAKSQRSAQPDGYMLGTREDVLLSAVVLGGLFAIIWFISIYEF
jgi:hypothetical protein